jgi:hypothetical protein
MSENPGTSAKVGPRAVGRDTTLTPDVVYALCAFFLNANEIIAADAVMDRTSLPAVRMPNREGFIADPRPDIGPRAMPR